MNFWKNVRHSSDEPLIYILPGSDEWKKYREENCLCIQEMVARRNRGLFLEDAEDAKTFEELKAIVCKFIIERY